MVRWRNVAHEINVRRPWKDVRIKGSPDYKPAVRQPAGRLNEELFQGCLAVFRIRPEVGDVSEVCFGAFNRPVDFRIDAAVKRHHSLRAQPKLKLLDG